MIVVSTPSSKGLPVEVSLAWSLTIVILYWVD